MQAGWAEATTEVNVKNIEGTKQTVRKNRQMENLLEKMKQYAFILKLKKKIKACCQTVKL